MLVYLCNMQTNNFSSFSIYLTIPTTTHATGNDSLVIITFNLTNQNQPSKIKTPKRKTT